jgi:thiosulfate/3-mercaptopyruvate sulfurtransferase
MIETMYDLNILDSGKAFLAALLIGIAFGFFLERAGFGSSRKLTGVFYFKDMAVIKVMFTAVMTAALGLSFLLSLGLISLDSIYLMPTVYGAHIVGGLIFGIGFVMGGWCPGTAAAGLAGGKLDALISLIGAVIGSALFNEIFAIVKPLYRAGQQGVLMVYDSLRMSRNGFILLLSVAAIAIFWGCEWIEKKNQKARTGNDFAILKVLTVLLLILPLGLIIAGQGIGTGARAVKSDVSVTEKQLLESIDQAIDHIEPEELADRLIAGQADLVLVDVRPTSEFAAFHIRGAINVSLADLADYLQPYKNTGMIVLYSNGMTHPAQARDSLYRGGFTNTYILTDGLNGFIERCLKPVSLRNEPLSEEMVLKINAWRSYFLFSDAVPESVIPPTISLPDPLVDVK